MRARAITSVVAATVVIVSGMALMGTAASAAPTLTVTNLIGGGDGDGGSPADAFTDAPVTAVAPSGDVYFFDNISGQIRRWHRATDKVEAVWGQQWRGSPAGGFGDGKDVRTVDIPDVTSMWVTSDDSVWLLLSVAPASGTLWRIDATGIIHQELSGSPSAPSMTVRSVSQAGSVVVTTQHQDAVIGHYNTLDVFTFDQLGGVPGGPSTWATSTQATQFTAAAFAPDGSLYAAAGGAIQHLSGPGNSTLVAGVAGAAPPANTARANPQVALGAPLAPNALDVAADGSLLYNENQDTGNGFVAQVRRFTVGGSVRDIVAPRPSTSYDLGPRRLAADSTSLYVGRSPDLGVAAYALNASSLAGAVVIGGTLAPNGRSAVGSVAENGYLGRSIGIATGRADGSVVVSAPGQLTGISADHGSGRLIQDLGSTMVLQAAGAPDGSVYLLTRHVDADLNPYDQIEVLHPDNTTTVVAGGGTTELAEAVSPLGSHLNASATFAMDPEGTTLFLAQQYQPNTYTIGALSLWSLPVAGGTWHHVSGGGATAPADGVVAAAVAWDLSERLIGATNVGGTPTPYLSGQDGGTYTVDTAGMLRRTSAPGLSGVDFPFVTADGSVWAQTSFGLGRTDPSGRFTVVGPTGISAVGQTAQGDVIVVRQSGLTPSVGLVTPPPVTPWPSALPSVSVASDGSSLTVAITKPVTPWPVQYELAVDPGSTPNFPPLYFAFPGNGSIFADASASAGTTTVVVPTASSGWVAPGATYTVHLWAWSTDLAVGTGGLSVSGVIPARTPAAPGQAQAVAGRGSATVTWSQPATDGGAAISGYVVTASPGGRTCTTIGALHCVVTGLAPGGSYAFSVAAKNSAGTGATATTTRVTIPAVAPGTIRSPKITYPTKGRAVVTWVAPASSGGAPLARYEYRVSASNGHSWARWVSVRTARSATVSGWVKGHHYLLQLRAVNRAGAGAATTLKCTPTR